MTVYGKYPTAFELLRREVSTQWDVSGNVGFYFGDIGPVLQDRSSRDKWYMTFGSGRLYESPLDCFIGEIPELRNLD